MADGGSPNTRLMAPVPFSFRSPQEIYSRTGGACDVAGAYSRTQLQEIRYAIQLWTFTVAAPGADGVIALGTERRSFAEGIDDVGAALGWGTPVLTQSETNLFPNGSLNNAKDGAFLARSLGFGIQRPFVYNATTGERTFSAVVDAYSPRAMRAVAEALGFTMFQRDNNASLDIGISQLWPGAQQVKECGFATLDEPNGANVILPLRRDYLFVDDNNGSQNFLIGRANRQITLTSDPAQPLPSGFSVPVLTAVYGEPVTWDAACAVNKVVDVAAQTGALIAQGYSLAEAKEMVMAAAKK